VSYRPSRGGRAGEREARFPLSHASHASHAREKTLFSASSIILRPATELERKWEETINIQRKPRHRGTLGTLAEWRKGGQRLNQDEVVGWMNLKETRDDGATMVEGAGVRMESSLKVGSPAQDPLTHCHMQTPALKAGKFCICNWCGLRLLPVPVTG